MVLIDNLGSPTDTIDIRSAIRPFNLRGMGVLTLDSLFDASLRWFNIKTRLGKRVGNHSKTFPPFLQDSE